jgi:2'-5' RNA ligase
LFVAIDIDEETRAQLLDLRAAVQRVLDAARERPRMTWVRPEVAHVTVRFLGEVAAPVATRVQESVSAPLGVPPFDLRWARVGAFPDVHRPRVIWLGALTGAEAMNAIARQLDERLAPILGPGEERAPEAHVTLGRVKHGGRGVNWAGAIAAARVAPTVTRVDRLTLYSSVLGPSGPTYTPVCRTALDG